MTEFVHKSVLFDEAIRGLNIKPDGIYVDGTLGGGGHSLGIAKRLSNKGMLIGIDKDDDALEAAEKILTPLSTDIRLLKGNFADLRSILESLGINKIDGLLLDLGVSSYQFDNGERGFSYRIDAPLDMRMDKTNSLNAEIIVNTYSIEELTRIIREYGEEKFARNIAKHIVEARKKAPIKTTLELVDIIKASIPAKLREGSGHPAKRTFQALRIEVNGELDDLKKIVTDAIDLLNVGGRMAVISFQSLEDRIVKDAFRKAENPCTCPPDFPVCVCGNKSKGRIITRKPITASEEELEANNRAHSAKLRIFERA